MKALFQKFVLWLYAKGFTFLVILGSAIKGERMSHNNGIVGRCKIKIVDNPEFPEHDFFQAGREFTGRLRHAGASFTDDAMLLIWGATLKFADADYESPLDVEMNTGKIALFWSASSFLNFAMNRKVQTHVGIEYEDWYPTVPKGLVAAMASCRRPTTYTQQHYYSKTCFHFKAKDGKTRYVKYRLLPADRGPENSIPPADELITPWRAMIKEGETRSRLHLKDDFKQRVENGGVQYHLQIQLHEWKDGDTEEVFNAFNYWPEDTHPWMDVATIDVYEILPYEQANYFRSSIGHHPDSLALIEPKSIHDYNSLNYMRWKSHTAKSVRVMYYKLFGMPKDYPPYGERNV